MALYAYEQLSKVAEHWDKKFEHDQNASFPRHLWLQHTPLSLSLIFCQPNEEIIFRYSLAKESTTVKVKKGESYEEEVRNYVHLFTMWDVDEQLIDNLCKDLMQDDAFDPNLFPKVTSQKVHKARVKNSLRQVRLPLKGRSFR
jgi:histidine decarboxylase